MVRRLYRGANYNYVRSTTPEKAFVLFIIIDGVVGRRLGVTGIPNVRER